MMKENFTIEVRDEGLCIQVDQEEAPTEIVKFSATEALMLLDILKAEEPFLRQLARKESPFPVTMGFAGA